MKIQSSFPSTAHVANFDPLTLTEGDIVKGIVKEKISDREAVIQVRGYDIKMTVDKPVKQDELIMIKVKGTGSDSIDAQILTKPRLSGTETEQMNELFKRIGVSASSPQLKKLITHVVKTGYPVNTKIAAILDRFIRQGNRSESEVRQTIEMLAAKRLEITSNHLQAVDEVLHGNGLKKLFLQLATKLDRTEDKEDQKLLKIIKVLTQQMQNVKTKDEGFAEKIDRLMQAVEGKQNLSDVLKEVKKLSFIQQKEFEQLLRIFRTGQEEVVDAIRSSNQKKNHESLLQSIARDSLIKIDRQALLKTFNVNEEEESIVRKLNDGIKLQQIATARLLQLLKQTSLQSNQLDSLRQSLKEAAKDMQSQPDVQQVLQKIKTQTLPLFSQQKDVHQSLQQAITTAEELLSAHKELAARQHIYNTLMSIKDTYAVEETETTSFSHATLKVSALPMTTKLAEAAEQFLPTPKAVDNQLQQLKDQILPLFSQQKDVHQSLHQAIVTAEELLSAHKESEARQHIYNALISVKDTYEVKGSIEAKGITSSSLPMTTKLAEAAEQFLPTPKAVHNQLQQVKDQILPLFSQQEDVHQSLQQAIKTAEELVNNQKETVARQHMHETLTMVKEQYQMEVSADLMKPLDILNFQGETKDLIVTTITKKLAEVTEQFSQMQKDINRQLLHVSDLLHEPKAIGKVQASHLIETTIKQLDRAILQSEFTLYADMKSEKDLLKASQWLQEAKSLLAKGQSQQAHALVEQVKDTIKQIEYKPSEQKMVHFVKDELFNKIDSQATMQKFMKSLPLAQGDEIGARDVYEVMKKLGVNREREIFQQLPVHKGADPTDLKSLLLKGEALVSPQTTELALQNVTGQQLLNKQDQPSSQQLYMQLPFVLQGEVANMKVFVQSQKQDEKIDWKNSSLYFLFETKKLGEVGVMLTSVDRQLSIAFRNNEQQFEEKANLLVAEIKDRIEQIGYRITGVSYSTFHEQEKQKEAAVETRLPHLPPKGFDYSI
ncbi:hypothetical protein FZC66_13465 [Priestia megaterium]|nr:hypothetical protein FZC66_13465 [Priestia megaterium]